MMARDSKVPSGVKCVGSDRPTWWNSQLGDELHELCGLLIR